MEHLEFLRLEGTVEVYQDKNSGEEVYIGRTKPSPEAVFKVAAKIITENMINPGQTSLKDRAAEDVAKAIKELEEVAKEFPNFWRVHWFLGKGQQAIGDIEESYKAFKRAWELEQENEAVPRELGGACLELGKAKEAVEVGEKASKSSISASKTIFIFMAVAVAVVAVAVAVVAVAVTGVTETDE